MLFRVNSGNPAVPMAQRQTGATQRSPLPADSTEQSLSFGKPSGNRDASSTFKASPLCPAVVQNSNQDEAAVSTSTTSPEIVGTHLESNREQIAASPNMLQDDRQQQELGTSASGQAESRLSATEASASGQAWAHGDDRYSDAQVQAASAPGSSAAATTSEDQSGAVGPASSSHHILQQQGAVAATTGSYSSSDANGAVDAHLSDAGTRRDHAHGAAQESIQHLLEANNTKLADPGECCRSICMPCVSDMAQHVHEHCIFLVTH